MASQLRAMVLVVVVVGALLFIVNTAIVNSQQSEQTDSATAQVLGQLRNEIEKEKTLITQVTSLVEEVERLKLENARLRGTQSTAATPASNPFAPAPTANPFSTQATPPPASGAISQPAAPAPAPNPFAQAGAANPAPALPPSAPPPPPPAPMPLTRSTGYTRVLRPAPADTVPTAVLLICYNRPRYLQRALDSIVKAYPQVNPPNLFISQDGSVATVAKVITNFISRAGSVLPAGVQVKHLHHKQDKQRGDDRFGYMPLARHFGWALGQLFDVHKAPRVIILEDDLEVAVDFFDYFAAVAPLLDQDDTLLAASAWNDLGQSQFVSNPETLYRSDFFPGLGWMINAKIWSELGPKWPNGYWDDWLREPPQRRGRATIRPEVSRSYTFGEVGVSQSQFFSKFLAKIKLNDVKVPWSRTDLSYLFKENYDAPFFAAVDGATTATVYALPPSCRTEHDFKVLYYGLEDRDARGGPSYVSVGKSLGMMADVKAKVPRGAYNGVVTVKYHGCRVFIAPAHPAKSTK